MAPEEKLNPTALSAGQAARMLGIPREWVEKDIESGAPTNADDTLNLVHYAAWLNRAMQEDGNGET